jgi:hypothetical protein
MLVPNLNIILNVFLFVTFFGPITTLLHELGHATVILLFTKKNVSIKLGKGRFHFIVKLPRIKILIHPFSGWVGYTSFETNKGEVSRKLLATFYFAGPISSFFTFLIAFFLQDLFSNTLNEFHKSQPLHLKGFKT